MLLALDVGNTNIVLGVFDGDARAQLAVTDAPGADVGRTRPVDRRVVLLQRHRQEQGEGHHPRLRRAAADWNGQAMVERYFALEALVRRSAQRRDADLYENPAEVGADRIVNAIAAYEWFGKQSGRPLVVCDFGTATTLDAVTAKGEYLGGAICPGVTIRPMRCFSARHGFRG